MTTIDINATVGQLVTARPSRSRLFERLGIDYCCGGGRSLLAACEKRGIEAGAVIELLREAERQADPHDAGGLVRPTLTDLADHIEQSHHAYLRRELPRLTAMIDKVASVHAESHPWLIELRRVFAAFVQELGAHMVKEERVLFPMIRRLEAGEVDTADAGPGLRDSVRLLEHEHDQAGDALAKLRDLTAGFTAPQGACNTFLAMLDGLAELERDMHMHVHKENNILFPRAWELEADPQHGR